MHRAVAAVPALAITLALFFLMQLLITPSSRDIPKPVAGGGVGLVTLIRETDSGSAQSEASRLVPPMPESASAPPPPPPAAMSQVAIPPVPDLSTEIPALEIPPIDAMPYLGGPPVKARKQPAVPAETKLARKTPSKQTSKKTSRTTRKSIRSSRSAQPQASPEGRGKSGGASTGKQTSGKGRSAGAIQGTGSSDKGSKSSGNSGIVVLSRPKPTYPRNALRNKEEGWVKVSFTVTANGTVSNPRVVAAKPRRLFDRSALQAIRTWRFKPKMVGGRPVNSKATQLIEFKLAQR